nr:hypothetical protein [Tanacetum cinerariifolium]
VVEKRVAKAIEEYEKARASSDKARSSGGNTENVGGAVASNVQGCSHNTFMNRKPHLFNRTEGVVGLSHWIEKVEQVFEISKCAEGDKVMFAASTFEGRALTWMKQELWIITLKGDDIESYNNSFHELALMCSDLVTPERKKIERIPIAGGKSLQNVTCFGCGVKGHYRDKCPRRRNSQNEGARGKAYIMRTEERQQDPNIVTGKTMPCWE